MNMYNPAAVGASDIILLPLSNGTAAYNASNTDGAGGASVKYFDYHYVV